MRLDRYAKTISVSQVIAQRSVTARISDSLTSWVILKPSFSQMRCISMFSGRISPKIRLMFSSRPTWRSRLSSSVPSPRPWKRSLTTSGEFGFAGAPDLAQTTDPENLVVAGLGVLVIGHQGHLAVIVDEADSRQPLVSHPRGVLHGVEVAKRDAPFREGSVELDQERLILGADRPQNDLGAVLDGQGSDVLRGIGPDRRLRKVRWRGPRARGR